MLDTLIDHATNNIVIPLGFTDVAIFERWDAWEGKVERRRTMPCEHTPDRSGYPTERLLEKLFYKRLMMIKVAPLKRKMRKRRARSSNG